MLPTYIRQKVGRRLFENGLRDYEGLAQWVRCHRMKSSTTACGAMAGASSNSSRHPDLSSKKEMTE
jgi:hypothetical protein